MCESNKAPKDIPVDVLLYHRSYQDAAFGIMYCRLNVQISSPKYDGDDLFAILNDGKHELVIREKKSEV